MERNKEKIIGLVREGLAQWNYGKPQGSGTRVLMHNLRAYDALHIAAAQLLKEKSGLEVFFLTFDRDQKTAAIREGLKIPPE